MTVVRINGEDREVTDGATIAEVLTELGREPNARGVAVALGGEVVPRAHWGRTRLAAGDRLEVVVAVQGG